MDWLHFLNLQYWYCIIYSAFGGECTYFDDINGSGNGTEEVVESKGVFESMFEALGLGGSAVWDVISGVVGFLWGAYSALAWTVSSFLALAILFALAGLMYIRFRELSLYGTLPPKNNGDSVRGDRWKDLLLEAMSTDPKRWRFAILEADKMLGELLGNLGYPGATTADKMRALPEGAFVTVPVAWEAHRVRNFVSQGSSDFILTQREAFRVMKLYEQVFEEFSFI